MRGDLRLGQQLPSVRTLAAMYGVSLPTMSAAIHVLAGLGMVRSAHGVGTFVTAPGHDASLLNYAWRAASLGELAIVRSTIDERAAITLAARVAERPGERVPRAVAALHFMAIERSGRRHDPVQYFVEADVNFHRTVLEGLRGIEVGPALYGRVAQRLRTVLESAAAQTAETAEDDRLDTAHHRLATAVMDGDVRSAVRTSRFIARAERRAVEAALG